MIIDFEDAHSRYLVARRDGSDWCYVPVNESKKAGLHLCSHQVFSTNGLGMALYLRNSYTNEKATRVHTSVKLRFSNKVDGEYLLAKDKYGISVELSIGAAGMLYDWLTYGESRFRYEVPTPSGATKALEGFVTEDGTPILRISEYRSHEGWNKIDVTLDSEACFHLKMHCIALGRLLYPTLGSDAVIACMRPQRRPAGWGKDSESNPTTQTPGQTIKPAQVSSDVAAGRRKGVFAVGINKWPAKRRDVIEHIQHNYNPDDHDRLIKSGNAGDFSEWDKIAELFDSIP